MSNLAGILKNALSLDVHDRATLAERLLASLEELSEDEADHLWAEEAQRRLKEYRAGRAKAVPADEVHQKAERLFRTYFRFRTGFLVCCSM
jgi:putative addiction module component (TIGR02574 family)